jgi:hypothetical protein
MELHIPPLLLIATIAVIAPLVGSVSKVEITPPTDLIFKV